MIPVLSVPEVFKTLRSGGVLRRYHRALHDYIKHEPLIRLLPALLNLPLFTTQGERFELSPHQQQGGHAIALHGGAGSGRSLALSQVAHHHTAENQAEPLLLLPLARSDTPELSPHEVLTDALKATGLPLPFENTSTSDVEQREPWLLLIDEWEKLPTLRRRSWRHFLEQFPTLWPEARVVLALPAQEAGGWSGFQSVVLAAPDGQLRQQWLAHLLPDHNLTPLFKAIQPGAPFERCGRCLASLVVLVIAYRSGELPPGTHELYKQVYTSFKNVLADTEQHYARGGGVALPFSCKQHASFIAGKTLQCYEVAHTLATTSRDVRLPPLEASEQAEIAALLADMVPDMGPIYRRLWGSSNQPTPENLLLMGFCVRERPACAPVWGVRILHTLANYHENQSYHHLLQSFGEHLPTLVAAAGENMAEASARLLLVLAPYLDPVHLLRMLETPTLPAPLRWSVAEALLMFPRKRSLFVGAPPPPDILAHAARCYVLALGDSHDRQLLAEDAPSAQVGALRSKCIPPRNRLRAAHALLNDPTTPATLRDVAVALLPRATEETTLPTLRQLCAHNEPEVRRSALQMLPRREPQQALKVLGALLLQAGAAWEAQRDALNHLARYHPGNNASSLLFFVALQGALPLHGRLRALVLLAARPRAGSLLRRLVGTEKAHPFIRAQAAWFLGQSGETTAIAELRTLLANNPPPIVQYEIIRAFGQFGKQPDVRAVIVAILGAMLRHPVVDTMRYLGIVEALGESGAAAAIPLLRGVLEAETTEQARTRWNKAAPHLATTPFGKWERADLPADIRAALFTTLTEGETEAEQIGSFEELIEQTAMRVRTAALNALARIGGSSSAEAATRDASRRALLDMLPALETPHEARYALGALARISEDGGARELEQVLAASSTTPTLRWLAVEQLGNTPAAVPLLTRYLEQETVDPLIGDIVVTFVGRHGSIQELPLLRDITTDPAVNLNLRCQAVAALGTLNDPAATETLINIVCNDDMPVSLRGAAAEALPPPLPTEKRQTLRDLLRQERQAPELVAGLLTALGRAGDTESLALMLRYAQSTFSAVALAGIAGITDVGNETVVPVLVRMAQNNTTDNVVRLHAVIALLHLYGADYLPFLRQFLGSSVLPLQLQALDCLLTLWPDDSQPVALLTSPQAPLPLRLRALCAVARHISHRDTLGNLLRDQAEPPQLHAAIAVVLGEEGDSGSVAALAHCATATTTTPYVRRRCIESLARLASSGGLCADVAQQALGRLVETPSLAAEIHTWAMQALNQATIAMASAKADTTAVVDWVD